jgi:hypothetical protein
LNFIVSIIYKRSRKSIKKPKHQMERLQNLSQNILSSKAKTPEQDKTDTKTQNQSPTSHNPKRSKKLHQIEEDGG